MASTNNIYNNSWPARRHETPALASTAAAAKSTGTLYKAIYFNVAGTADVIDSSGAVEKVIAPAGAIYPVQNFGVQTGGNTTLASGEFVCLYD